MPRSSVNAPQPLPHERRNKAARNKAARNKEQPVSTPTEDSRQWPLYEVFVRARGGLDHKHVGSLHAADARMAIDHARDLYTRRQEGISIWVVPSKDITASDPAEADSLFEPARDKIYRHPTFYDIPDEVKTL
jgi:ring-1,2-phenylacetyl-CoA epoxidase subunit PaaB